ncbi:copper chaperone PCu(A)C [Dactylosporangium sp. AC04546]|uniref:copper chaperone PCu(A)C n=1 Tax=Dactylosporangium sp. AC04546 TaxID=2862460 RepID=UPI001EE08C52|nr:copper chaperone PCu(A)C [Dactylosporangium sp. AC04546]WVK80390.1 copper chaperone PCu(A)C [Dactylosporangium sp. AC04546]
MSLRHRSLLATAGAILALALAACGSEESPSTAPSGQTAPTSPASASAQPALVVKDPWVKTAQSGMSAAYGTLLNTTGTDIVVVSATSTASPKVELHETTTVDGKMAMRPKEGGFVIPADSSHEFKPGGDHFMLMDVTTPVRPGDQITVTLTLKDGSTVQFTALGKDFAGGNESYHPGQSASPMVMG